jgi:hypothetical protein
VIESWVLAAAAAWAVAALLVPGPLPRRFPEDDVAPGPGAPVRRGGSGLVGTIGGARRRTVVLRRRSGRSPGALDDEPVLDDLATCCDLLAVAAASGAPVAAAIAAVGGVGRGPVGRALGDVAAAIDRGARVADAIAGLPDVLGPAARPLTTTLLTAAGSGAPPDAGLWRLADAERRRARRRVEARVRRLPVLLLLPLVGCILPAFVLLTLVPVGLSAARGAGVAAPGPTVLAPLPPDVTPSGDDP